MTTVANHKFNTAPSGEKCRVAKVDSERGIIFGFGAVCTEQGAPYFDLHGDHLPEDEMITATTDFAKSARSAKIMHAGEDVGQVVQVFSMAGDIFKSLWPDMPEPTRTGVIIAWQPNDKALLQKFADGDWTGFSFGGTAYRDEVVEEVE